MPNPCHPLLALSGYGKGLLRSEKQEKVLRVQARGLLFSHNQVSIFLNVCNHIAVGKC
jgi:hypothetical protein